MGLAEERVEPLKVTTAGQGGRVGGGKGVENFGGKAAGAHERTSRRAPITGESGSEGGEPPVPVGDSIFQCGLQGKETGGTAHVSMTAKNFRTVFGLLFFERKLLPEGGQNIPSTGMPDPA